MKKKKAENYLDYVPIIVLPCENWKREEKQVVITVENKGFYNLLAQKCFHRPRFSQIHLDELGSFIWEQIDGKRSVYQIGKLLDAEFHEKASPLYQRLAGFLRILYSNKLIGYCKEHGLPT